MRYNGKEKEEAMPKRSASQRGPKDMQARFEAITQLTDTFCRLYLNEEYAQLCRELAATLCRKRLSPLLWGKVTTLGLRDHSCGFAWSTTSSIPHRHAPREVQEAAFRQGLIPYILEA